MHIQQCEHPKRLFNKYTKEWQYVPCGKCPQCLKSRAQKWTTRLNVERKCWKYCLFFTLTYSEENVPYLEKLDNGYLIDPIARHSAPGSPVSVINLSDIFLKLSPERKSKLQSFLDSREKFSYLSVYDAQLFVKRLRKNITTLIKNSFKEYDEKDTIIRYYIIGEYGSTTFRGHLHGLLYFSSEKEKTYIEEAVHKSWKLGITDTSFVSESNAAYLSKYLNCSTGMPEIYEHKSIRPFAIFSKEPPIGTMYFNDETVREIFDTSSCSMLVDYYKGLSLVSVPLWKTYEDRIFPKISLFNRFTHFDRIRLYRASLYFAENYPLNFSSIDFAKFMFNHAFNMGDVDPFGRFYLHVYDDYIKCLSDNVDDVFGCLVRWFYISKRVCTQAAAFDVSVAEYVTHIEKYYDNKEVYKLNSQFTFEGQYAEDFGSRSLIGLDRLYLESILDRPLEDFSLEEIMTLESYGIDIQKFTSDDLSERLEYQYELLPENTRDFRDVVLDSASWLKKHTKTKIKNDYLASHPELTNYYNSIINPLNKLKHG